MKPDIQTILAEARRLHDERFSKRNTKLKMRAQERFNETKVNVPAGYAKTAHQHDSNIIEDEGRMVATLVHAKPVPHLTPPVPEDQPLTTNVENNLTAGFAELEMHNGPVSRQCTMAQVHDNIGWIFFCPKKVAYMGQPKPPADEADFVEMAEYQLKNTQYKRDAGWKAIFDYEFAVTATVLPDGNVHDPHCVYIWKEVPLSTLRKTYGVYKNSNGSFSKPEDPDAHPPTGYEQGASSAETMVNVVEYWDRDWCIIVAETSQSQWLGMKQVKGGYLLTEWEHKHGRVPYFARPAFVTEQLDEDKKFAGPLDGIYNEMPTHKRLRTMMDNVAYNTAFASLQLVTQKDGDSIVDDSPAILTFTDLEPGKIKLLPPGSKIETMPQSPEIGILANEVMASEARIQRYSLPPASRGESPGADTANAALSNMHRWALSTFDPMADAAALQWQAMMRFALERIRAMQETVYVLDPETDSYLSLSAEGIPSVNVQVKATPDQGQQQLLIEKHAMELWLQGAITENEMHEMRGKEAPEEYTAANAAERLKKMIEPIAMHQLITDFGMLDAMNAMAEQNAQGQPSSAAVPGLMEQARGQNGMGQGSPGQPRQPGTRMPTVDVNTAADQAGGY